ncbi:MAG: 2-hydroxyglutaryl-CoA dehydratase [Acutalibacteraceae bacterium]
MVYYKQYINACEVKTTDAVFTKEMRKTHTILLPQMLEYHFPILRAAMIRGGYRCEILTNGGSSLTETGKRYVHNDMCFPAVLIIGQMINALEIGLYDPNRVAFMLPQTGGACRASNYYHLLKKALKAAGYGYIPVISLNLSNMNTQPGFNISPAMISTAVKAVLLGDLLMHLSLQTEPYEKNPGDTAALLKGWQDRLCKSLSNGEINSQSKLKIISREILESFSQIEVIKVKKTEVGIVGELYIKYCSLGNHGAPRFLLNHGCEVHTAGFSVYAFYTLEGIIYDCLSGAAVKKASALLLNYLQKMHNTICDTVLEFPVFSPMPRYLEYSKNAGKILSPECITGDGWLISAEAATLIDNGCEKILALNPFGCLVSHINCKGIVSALKKSYPAAKITAIDCDADQSPALFESRLLLSIG